MAGPGQGWNSGFARLCDLNSPHFSLEQCEVDEAEMKQGSGRVAMFKECRLRLGRLKLQRPFR